MISLKCSKHSSENYIKLRMLADKQSVSYLSKTQPAVNSVLGLVPAGWQ